MWSQQKNNGWKSSTSPNSSNKNGSPVNGQAEPKIFGITSAISTAEPKPSDLTRTDDLEKVLRSYNVFEDESEIQHRMNILGKLNTLVREWTKAISLKKNLPPNIAEKVGGVVCTFGSYRLGVHHKNADIDALCVTPRLISRNDYFNSFYELLKEQKEVTDLRSVKDAFVPVIKMKFDGIEIDMLFANLDAKEVTEDINLSDDRILKHLTHKDVLSLNGCRVTDAILNLVPDKTAFRLALRTIKLWAKKQGIYSNSLGYLGGVSWAILVARTCQLYPKACASTIIEKFFLVFSQWKWPQPVLLKQPDNIDLGFPVWDPRNVLADRFHLMPIITPAYPQQNSTYNVSNSSLAVIKESFDKGLAITEDIIMGRATWTKLFDPPNFFAKYKHYIVLIASSLTPEDHVEWCGLVESRIRYLILSLEKKFVALAHVSPESFSPKPKPSEAMEYRLCSMWFIGLQFQKEQKEVDLRKVIFDFVSMKVCAESAYKKEGTLIEVRHVKKKDLINYLPAEILKKDKAAAPVSKKSISESGLSSVKKCEANSSTSSIDINTSTGSTSSPNDKRKRLSEEIIDSKKRKTEADSVTSTQDLDTSKDDSKMTDASDEKSKRCKNESESSQPSSQSPPKLDVPISTNEESCSST